MEEGAAGQCDGGARTEQAWRRSDSGEQSHSKCELLLLTQEVPLLHWSWEDLKTELATKFLGSRTRWTYEIQAGTQKSISPSCKSCCATLCRLAASARSHSILRVPPPPLLLFQPKMQVHSCLGTSWPPRLWLRADRKAGREDCGFSHPRWTGSYSKKSAEIWDVLPTSLNVSWGPGEHRNLWDFPGLASGSWLWMEGLSYWRKPSAFVEVLWPWSSFPKLSPPIIVYFCLLKNPLTH